MTSNEEIDIVDLINPQPKQQTAIEVLLKSKCKYLLYGGAMAGGKSYVLRWAAVSYLMYIWHRTGIYNIPVGLFSEDYPTLKDRQISKIEREFPKWLGRLKEDKVWGLSFQLDRDYGGGIILLRNLDDPSKYMSTEFAAEFVEELTRNDSQTFEDLRNRLRFPGVEEVKFMGASNPGGIGHGWVRSKFIDGDQEDPEADRFFYVHATAYDNKFISPSYLKQLESLPPQKRKAYLEGSWDVFEGQFFSEFTRGKHVIEPIRPLRHFTRIGSIDWGYNAPFCFLAHVLRHEKMDDGTTFNRVITFGELYGKEQKPEVWAERIDKEWGIETFDKIMADPSMFNKKSDGSISISEQMKSAWPEELATILKPASNDRVPGWTIMHSWLSLAPDGLPYWLITENCKNLIRTLPQQVYDENNNEDIDSDGEDHAADAARYGLKHIKWIDARVGGIGKTPSGKEEKRFAIMIKGKQQAVDLDKFATAYSKKRRYRN